MMGLATEQILSIVGLLLALGIAIGALRDHRAWERWEKKRDQETEKRERRSGFGGPWGD